MNDKILNYEHYEGDLSATDYSVLSSSFKESFRYISNNIIKNAQAIENMEGLVDNFLDHIGGVINNLTERIKKLEVMLIDEM